MGAFIVLAEQFFELNHGLGFGAVIVKLLRTVQFYLVRMRHRSQPRNCRSSCKCFNKLHFVLP